jgi:hypothetical protein
MELHDSDEVTATRTICNAMSREPELLADVERREKRCGGSSALASSADTCPLRSCRNVTAGFTTMPGGLPAHETASRRNRV